MNERGAAVAVIGGGVIGASVAWHLARQGVRDIVIIDRANGPGEGSTGKATGGFRAQFATPVNIQLSLQSRASLLRFLNDTGVDPGFSQVGYLWLAENDAELDSLRDALRTQHAEGLTESVELSTDEIGEVNPAIVTGGIIGAAFCRTDGYIRPLEILRGYLAAAEAMAVRIMWNTECTGFMLTDTGRIRTVLTSRGSIEVDFVVNAGGAWAACVAAMARVALPVTPLRRQAAYTDPCAEIPASMPMTIFMRTGFHLRARDGRALLVLPCDEEAGFRDPLRVDDSWIDSVTKIAREWVPALRDVAIDPDRCYAGFYEMSPDKLAIVGRSAECENMFLVNGSSGHGVMHSPALGSIVADLVCGIEPRLDITPLRPTRFTEGTPALSRELM